jgi:hypothetical protein
MPMKPSVVMPVYNERTTLREIIGKVLAIPIESDDGSHEILPSCETDTYLKFFIFFFKIAYVYIISALAS